VSIPVVEAKTMEVAAQAGRSVVTILSLQKGAETPADVGEVKTLGSGLVLDEQGHIVTNYHVVANPENLRVILPDGTQYQATVVGVDEFTDLAVIHIDAAGLVPAVLGDSSELRPGQWVIAIGSALGEFRNTVTVGVVSGLDRRVLIPDQAYALEDLIQTDAAINHGNSGGPLLNLDGEVVGINTILVRRQRYSDEDVQGIGFAIPINVVRRIVPDLIEHGRVPRPYLGVTVRMVTPQLKADLALPVDHGAWIDEVLPDSPAARAGLRHGDVILSLDGVPVNDEHPFLNVLMRYRIGDTVELRVNRVGEELTFEITLASNQ
jgi:2-alkenal reductase